MVFRIHIHDDSNYLDESIFCEMLATLHHQQDFSEFLEVYVLLRLQRVFLEEFRNFFQARSLTNSKLISIFVVSPNNTAFEESLQSIQDLDVPFMLNHSEFWKNLVSRFHSPIPVDSNVEASFTIDKPNNPIRFEVQNLHSLSQKLDARRTVSEDPLTGFLRIAQSLPFLPELAAAPR